MQSTTSSPLAPSTKHTAEHAVAFTSPSQQPGFDCVLSYTDDEPDNMSPAPEHGTHAHQPTEEEDECVYGHGLTNHDAVHMHAHHSRGP